MCLWPHLGPSVYLSQRISWIISSFPGWISKILFVLDSLDYFGSLGCRIGEGLFSILSLGSVYKITSPINKVDWKFMKWKFIDFTYSTCNWTTMVDFSHHIRDLIFTSSFNISIFINPETVEFIRSCALCCTRITGFTNFQAWTIETVVMASSPVDWKKKSRNQVLMYTNFQ